MPKCVPDLPLEQRFWSRVDRRGDNECWPWTKAVSAGGGVFWVRAGELGFERGAPKAAYLVAFRLVHGRWPRPLGLHGCDNRMCCNPLNPELGLHVHEGTAKENTRQMLDRGRQVITRTTHKLSDAQVAEIRARYSYGRKPSQRDLAREYGVSMAAVSLIIRRETYKHV